MTKVFWTHEEREAVIAQAVELRHFRSYKLLEAVKAAQKLVLPIHRQRPVNSPSSCVEITKEVRARTLEGIKPIKTPTAPVTEAPVTHQVTLVEAIDPLDDAINAIATHLANKIADEMRNKLKDVQELEHFFSVQKHNPAYEGNRLFKPRITIIGLLGDQVHSIEKEFGETFAVRCIDTDRAMGMSPPDADAYLLMKNFINHPLYHKYQRFPNHVLIDGGMTSLRMWFHTKGKDI